MKIMKLLAACAMVGALATTTAMAEEFLVRDEFRAVVYDATNNAVTINLDAADIKDYVDVNNITGDLTVLVTNVATGTVSNTQIFQIDQGTRTALDNDGNDGTSTCVLKLSAAVKADYDAIMNPNAGTETVAEGEESTKPASSTYYVRLGGAESGYIEDTFVFTAPKQEEPEDPKPETTQVVVGDFSANGDVSTEDMKLIGACLAGSYDTFEEIDYYAAAWSDDNVELSTEDMKEIGAALAGSGGDRIWYFADLYYDEESEEYYVYGDLYDE